VFTTQNDVLVSIEDNIDDTEVKVNKGSKEMVKAVKVRKSSRKVSFFFFFFKKKIQFMV